MCTYKKDYNINSLTTIILLVCFIIIAIKHLFVPLTIYKNIDYLGVKIDNIINIVYDCKVEHYLSGKTIIYHDSGIIEIDNINDVLFYSNGMQNMEIL